MTEVKVAVIGAGSYVFGLSALKQALLDHRLDGIELALMDVDAEALGAMAGVGRRMAKDMGLGARITAHTERGPAMEGASFVLCAAAVQLARCYQVDCEIALRFCPGHIITEFGGVQGISYSLRQIALIDDIAADMKRLCPGAWLLNACNPLPRVCQAAHEAGVRTAGFCSSAMSIFGRMWRWFGGGDEREYPWPEGQDAYALTYAGLNHFCWLLAARDRRTGADLLPQLPQRLKEFNYAAYNPLSMDLFERTGYLPLPHDGHLQDFVEPTAKSRPLHEIQHGTAEERAERLAMLRDVGDRRRDLADLPVQTSWERPMDFVAAMAFGRSAAFHGLNLINDGQIADLPRNVFVETPCLVTGDGPVPERIELPAAVLPYARRTARVTDTIVRAARGRKRSLVHEAVELDPTILDTKAGLAAIDACMKAHAALLPPYD